MYARCPGLCVLALSWLLAAAGCEKPETAIPGLEPPGPRDAGADDGEGNAPGAQPPTGTPSQPRLDAGAGPPPVVQPSGGMSGSVAGGTATENPPPNTDPSDEDAGSEP